jgi:hypothetical protein
MLLEDFRFKDNFYGLSDDELQLAIDEAEITWSGVRTLWGILPEAVQTQKRDLCMNYICAWYIADLYPKNLRPGMYNAGGTVLTHKSIEGVSLGFKVRSIQPGMEQFQSNVFGLKALDMLVNAPDMQVIRG